MTIVIIVLFVFFIPAFSKDIKDMTVPELLQLSETLTQVRPNDVTQEDVAFYLFTNNTSQQRVYSNSTTEDFDPIKPTKILIHGWLESHSRPWYQQLTREYLHKGDFNIIQVDWERVAKSSYVSSARNCKLVGEKIGEFILNQDVPFTSVHLIGHSLGAHVAAFAAKKIWAEMGKKIARITALDPAGPYFNEPFITTNERLTSEDASIVDVIHTDAGFYGYERPMGTLDIYINGGTRPQPGCIQNFRVVPVGQFIENTFCSHAKSTDYFIDLIEKKKFTCTKCESLELYLSGRCDSNEKYVIGAEDIDEGVTGLCFTRTNSQVPQLLNDLFGFQFGNYKEWIPK